MNKEIRFHQIATFSYRFLFFILEPTIKLITGIFDLQKK